jgi:hypothetical protein
MELGLCRETRNSVISIKDLCTKYQELMATNPFLSASASGYIKKKKNNSTIMRRNSKYRKRKSGKNKGTRRKRPPS